MDKKFPAFSATLLAPDERREALPAKEMLRSLGAFNNQITDMMIKLGTKNPADKVLLQFEFSFQESNVTHAEQIDGKGCQTFRFHFYCNGGD